MENKKYEFTGETKTFCGVTLRRIRALVTIIGVVNSGDCGGWIESENNLQVYGNAWVSGNAQVSGKAQVYGNAQVSGKAQVYGNAQVFDNVRVYGNAQVFDNARVYGDTGVFGNTWVFGNAQVYGDARVYGNAWVSGNAQVSGNARVYGDTGVCGNTWVCGDAQVYGNAAICTFSGFGSKFRTTTAFINKEIGIRVVCGCFTGTLEQFRKQVIQTHGEDSKNGKLYLGMANMIEYRLEGCEQ